MVIVINLTEVIITATICIAIVTLYSRYLRYALTKDRRKREQNPLIFHYGIDYGNAEPVDDGGEDVL